jgi:hypothetical protein
MSKAENSRKIPLKKLLLILTGVLILIIIIASGLFYYKYQKSQELLKNPKLAQANEAQELVVKVGKLIKLPSELPSIATVSDISKLSSQPIFRNAQNGDKVLIFNQAKRAIVYRPSENQIVEVGNLVVTTGANPSGQPPAPTITQKAVKVSVYNGTATKGLAKTQAENLKAKFPSIEIAETANAAGEYDKTIVIDVTGKNSEFAKVLATELGAQVGKLPTDEAKPASDILIIIGE